MRCPFCGKTVKEFHPNSHVVPEWLYKLSFGKKYKNYTVDLSVNDIELAQSGFKKSFICWDCENKFGEDDRYASLVLGKKRSRSTVKNIADAKEKIFRGEKGYEIRYVLEGIDFKRLQKFVFGVVMKGHMAKTDGGVSFLGDKHFSKIKKLYDDLSDLDDEAYPIFVQRIDELDPLREAVQQPYRGKGKEMNLATFMGGGYLFHVVVQSHPISNLYLNLRLKSDGKMIVPIVRVSHLPAAWKALEESKELKRKRWSSGK